MAIDAGDYVRLMNSKKEYGANCIVRQTVLFGDSVVERESENGRGDADREELEDLQIQGGSPKEGGSTFEVQFTQRMKKKRGKGAPVTSPKANRKKRSREVVGSDDSNLSGRPIVTPVNCFKKKALDTREGD